MCPETVLVSIGASVIIVADREIPVERRNHCSRFTMRRSFLFVAVVSTLLMLTGEYV